MGEGGQGDRREAGIASGAVRYLPGATHDRTKQRAMKRLALAFIALVAAVSGGGCANSPPPLAGATGQQFSVERPHAAEAMVQQGMSPSGVGATSDSAGGVVGPEYWKY